MSVPQAHLCPLQPLGLLSVEQRSCLMRTDKVETTGLLMTGQRALSKECHPEGWSLAQTSTPWAAPGDGGGRSGKYMESRSKKEGTGRLT